MINIKKRQKKVFIYTILIFAILILAWFFGDSWQRNKILNDKKSKILLDLEHHGNLIKLAVKKRSVMLEGLRAMIIAEITDGAESGFNEIEYYTSIAYKKVPGIRNIIIAPDGINRFVYPIAGNEVSLGHNLLTDVRENVQKDIKNALRTGLVTFSGPYELQQGGLGIVARLAIYDKGVFWGFVTMVLDVPPIISDSLLNFERHDYFYALFSAELVFSGEKRILNEDPVISNIMLQNVAWHLAAVPFEGWDKFVNKKIFLYRFFELFFIFLITLIVYLILSKQSSLEVQVLKRTSDLLTETIEHKKANELLKQSEEKLLKLVNQKEYLMKELQHRVKNNLNVISSLLALGISNLQDDKSHQIFNNAINRIMAMSTIYERLYVSDDLQSIDLHLYVEDLAKTVFKTYNLDTGSIILLTDLSEIRCDSKLAIPIGLILNELISNALKYAFPNQNRGEIKVSLYKKDNIITFRVKDNGVGLPSGFNLETTGSMGTQLIKMLAQQIGSEIIVDISEGTDISLSVQIP